MDFGLSYVQTKPNVVDKKKGHRSTLAKELATLELFACFKEGQQSLACLVLVGLPAKPGKLSSPSGMSNKLGRPWTLNPLISGNTKKNGENPMKILWTHHCNHQQGVRRVGFHRFSTCRLSKSRQDHPNDATTLLCQWKTIWKSHSSCWSSPKIASLP